MKTVAIVGAGPAGLFLAGYLSDFAKVNLYEASNSVLGHYKYAKELKTKLFDAILEKKNVNLFKNSKIDNLNDLKEDAVVLATGATAKKPLENTQCAYDIIKKHFNKVKFDLGKNVCIVGAGNVAMDLLEVLNTKIKEATILCRSDLFNAKFSNLNLSDIEAKYNISHNIKDIDQLDPQNRIDRRRKEIIKKPAKSGKPNLNILFNTQFIKSDGKNVTYKTDNKMFNNAYDTVISSIGFIPNCDYKKPGNKPFYKLGWCNNSSGDISRTKVEADALATLIRDNLTFLA